MSPAERVRCSTPPRLHQLALRVRPSEPNEQHSMLAMPSDASVLAMPSQSTAAAASASTIRPLRDDGRLQQVLQQQRGQREEWPPCIPARRVSISASDLRHRPAEEMTLPNAADRRRRNLARIRRRTHETGRRGRRGRDGRSWCTTGLGRRGKRCVCVCVEIFEAPLGTPARAWTHPRADSHSYIRHYKLGDTGR